MVRSSFYFLLLLFVANAAYAKKSKFVLPKIFSSGKVILGSTVTESSKEVAEDFELFDLSYFSRSSITNGNGHPMATTGDYNNDGYRDIVVLGLSKEKKRHFVVAFISSEQSRTYKSFIIMNYELTNSKLVNNPFYLRTISKIGNKKLSREIFQIESSGQGGASVHPFYYSKTSKKTKLYKGTFD